MKKTIITTLLLAAVISAKAEVRTYTGSQRWLTTLFSPDVRTAKAKTNYSTFTIVENDGTNVTGVLKIDAWSSRNPSTRVIERYYYVDTGFAMEYGFFGPGGSQVAGGMQYTGLSVVIPFRGTLAYGDLGSFVLYPSHDYYRADNAVDITAITGSGRLNSAFSSSTATIDDAATAVVNHLESRGYVSAN